METPNYPGDAKAAEILDRANSFYNVGSLKALMAGCLLGKSFVQPSTVMDHIEFNVLNNPDFGDKKLAQEFLAMFFGLWNNIADHRNRDQPFCFSPPDNGLDLSDVGGWMIFAENLNNELGEFLGGFELSSTPALSELNGQGGMGTNNYLPYLVAEKMGTLEREIKRLHKGAATDGRKIQDISLAIKHDLKTHHASFLALMNSIQRVTTATSNPSVRAEPKMGRNDPCPCGSEKKYKQCCLH